MQKEGVFESGKDFIILNERDIMVELDSPYVLKLEFAFETKNYVILALECKKYLI